MVDQFLVNNPVIKWTGTKRHFWKQMSHLIPAGKRVWIEPFLGSGSLLPYLEEDTIYIGNDMNPQLIPLWKTIEQFPHELANSYAEHWHNLEAYGQEYYYSARTEFNIAPTVGTFLFLLRTCMNGLVRYNSKGEFNSAFHHSRLGIKPETMTEIILRWSKHINDHRIFFFCGDYLDFLRNTAGWSDSIWVFLDPPYTRSNGKMYSTSRFDFEQFETVASTLPVDTLITLDVDSLKGYTIVPAKVWGNSPFRRTQGVIEKISEGIFSNYLETT